MLRRIISWRRTGILCLVLVAERRSFMATVYLRQQGRVQRPDAAVWDIFSLSSSERILDGSLDAHRGIFSEYLWPLLISGVTGSASLDRRLCTHCAGFFCNCGTNMEWTCQRNNPPLDTLGSCRICVIILRQSMYENYVAKLSVFVGRRVIPQRTMLHAQLRQRG